MLGNHPSAEDPMYGQQSDATRLLSKGLSAPCTETWDALLCTDMGVELTCDLHALCPVRFVQSIG